MLEVLVFNVFSFEPRRTASIGSSKDKGIIPTVLLLKLSSSSRSILPSRCWKLSSQWDSLQCKTPSNSKIKVTNTRRANSFCRICNFNNTTSLCPEGCDGRQRSLRSPAWTRDVSSPSSSLCVYARWIELSCMWRAHLTYTSQRKTSRLLPKLSTLKRYTCLFANEIANACKSNQVHANTCEISSGRQFKITIADYPHARENQEQNHINKL